MEISFELRFSREKEKHNSELKKRSELASQFVKKRRERLPNKVKSVLLYPVSRAGKSGSEVFYLDIFVENIFLPQNFIAKFQDVKNTEAELESGKIASFSAICRDVDAVFDKDNDLGMLVYGLAELPQFVEFRAYFLDLGNPEEECANALRSVYGRLSRHPNSKAEHKDFLDDHAWYLDKKNQPRSRIESLKSSSLNYSGVSQLAKAIDSHYSRISALLKGVKVFPYLVHGDLHARNLMLSAKNPNDTELIDFAWAHYGHPAKDFSLMEVTLKYMLLRELLHIRGPENTGSHLPLSAYEKFERYLCEHIFELPEATEFEEHMKSSDDVLDYHILILRRTYVSLKVLIKSAQEVLDKYCEEYQENSSLSPKEHFLISNFLVTFGLNGFQEVEPIWVLVGLDILGGYICRS